MSIGWPALAADYEIPLTLPRNAKIELTVERSRSGYGVQFMAGKAMTFHYRQEIGPAGEGYRVHQYRTGTDMPDGLDPAARASVQQALSSFDDVTYEADSSLSPVRIADWQAYANSMTEAAAGAAAKNPNARAAIEGTRDMFRRMTPEQGAGLLKEQSMVAVPQNAVLDLRAPRSETSEILNPLGGGPIKTNMSLELESIDSRRKLATVHFRQEVDPVSASRSTRDILTALAARLPAGAHRPDPNELGDVKIENTLDCRYQMDMQTGLAAHTECSSTVSSVDQNLQRATRTDRWVITQRLVP